MSSSSFPVILDDLLMFIRAHLEHNDTECGRLANDVLTAVQQQNQQQQSSSSSSSTNAFDANNNKITPSKIKFSGGDEENIRNTATTNATIPTVDSINNALSLLTQENISNFFHIVASGGVKSTAVSTSRAVSLAQHLTSENGEKVDDADAALVEKELQPQLSQVLSQIAAIQQQQQKQQSLSQVQNESTATITSTTTPSSSQNKKGRGKKNIAEKEQDKQPLSLFLTESQCCEAENELRSAAVSAALATYAVWCQLDKAPQLVGVSPEYAERVKCSIDCAVALATTVFPYEVIESSMAHHVHDEKTKQETENEKVKVTKAAGKKFGKAAQQKKASLQQDSAATTVTATTTDAEKIGTDKKSKTFHEKFYLDVPRRSSSEIELLKKLFQDLSVSATTCENEFKALEESYNSASGGTSSFITSSSRQPSISAVIDDINNNSHSVFSSSQALLANNTFFGGFVNNNNNNNNNLSSRNSTPGSKSQQQQQQGVNTFIKRSSLEALVFSFKKVATILSILAYHILCVDQDVATKGERDVFFNQVQLSKTTRLPSISKEAGRRRQRSPDQKENTINDKNQKQELPPLSGMANTNNSRRQITANTDNSVASQNKSQHFDQANLPVSQVRRIQRGNALTLLKNSSPTNLSTTNNLFDDAGEELDGLAGGGFDEFEMSMLVQAEGQHQKRNNNNNNDEPSFIELSQDDSLMLSQQEPKKKNSKTILHQKHNDEIDLLSSPNVSGILNQLGNNKSNKNQSAAQQQQQPQSNPFRNVTVRYWSSVVADKNTGKTDFVLSKTSLINLLVSSNNSKQQQQQQQQPEQKKWYGSR